MDTPAFQKLPCFRQGTCFIGKGAPERCALSIWWLREVTSNK
jgi:hypothetical protein